MATEVTKFRGGDHTTKLHHTIYSLRHTAIRHAHDSVRGSGNIFNFAKNAGTFSCMVLGRSLGELIRIEQKCSAVTVNCYR